ncbi:MAG: hypothetical protein S4CHLAM45_11310 [Chlamydiales bacterium]|nr:hypothetical protein [Chlamydiales bacterium]MCH9619623.1 hypothetical protein [Chlamydiales bacterium]MCH9623229.1 hypothetical protein [Chlamydiales bacterium]
MNRRIRKRSFLLLEIVLSLALIALCLFPLVKPHLAIKKEEYAYVQKLKQRPLLQNARCQFLEDLYSHKYSVTQLRENFNLSEAKQKPSLNKRGYLLTVHLNSAEEVEPHTFFIEELL